MKRVVLEVMFVDRYGFNRIFDEGVNLFSRSPIEIKAIEESLSLPHTHRVIIEGDGDDFERAVKFFTLDGFYEVSAD